MLPASFNAFLSSGSDWRAQARILNRRPNAMSRQQQICRLVNFFLWCWCLFSTPSLNLAKMFLITFFLLNVALAFPHQTLLFPQDEAEYGPSIETANANANSIFNAIHSSMRQWGSSVQHNGMSIFPARIPEGTLLYHGWPDNKPPGFPEGGLDWLAFEIEHAEFFAQGMQRDDGHFEPGYLHVYQTNRPLELLYIDGMSAGKSPLGTLDTQDILLLNTTREVLDDSRATELCKMALGWKIDGFIRMEVGFEVIKCNKFMDGFDLVSIKKRPSLYDPEGYSTFFELIRAISARYDGIDAARVTLDYSSMVSAYFYLPELSYPDTSISVFPRLTSFTSEQLARIKDDIAATLSQPRTYDSVNWQGVTDMVISRYSLRLQNLAENPSPEVQLSIVNDLLNIYIDYEPFSIDSAINECTTHYLLPAQLSTEQDNLIYAAFKTVLSRICTTLFDIRGQLLDKEDKSHKIKTVENTSTPATLIEELIPWLDWTTWKACGPCDLDEVCFIAMWPFGGREDHNNPRCLNRSELTEHALKGPRYWNPVRQPGEYQDIPHFEILKGIISGGGMEYPRSKRFFEAEWLE
jgi:hypothetical protein